MPPDSSASTLIVGSDPALQAMFHSRRYDADGWLGSHAMDLVAIDFRASVRIQNPGSGHPPTRLFNEMATNWRGWHGEKSWGAWDGELQLEATADAIGHVTLRITIACIETSRCWSAEARLMIEAGQLERIAHEAEGFFARRGD